MSLTVLLPLKGRPDFTLRWLSYAEQSLPFQVLVADGSLEVDTPAVTARCAELVGRGFPIEYIRYPHDSALNIFYAKLADALSRIRTPYVVLQDNDDLPWAAGLRRCVDFLEANPAYAACGGRIIGFTLAGDERRLRGAAIFESAPDAFDLSQASALDRIRAHFTRYHPTWYDVHRTPILAEATRALAAAEPADAFLVELWTSFLTLSRGPIGHLPTTCLFRQRDTPTSWAASDATGYRARSRDPEWRPEADRLCAAIASAATAVDKLPEAEAREAVTAAFDAYLSRAIASERSNRPHPLRQRLSSALSSNGAGRAVLRPLKAVSAALRRLRARPLPVEARAAARAIGAFLREAQKS